MQCTSFVQYISLVGCVPCGQGAIKCLVAFVCHSYISILYYVDIVSLSHTRMPPKSKKPPVNINLLPSSPAYQPLEAGVKQREAIAFHTSSIEPLGCIPIILHTRYIGDILRRIPYKAQTLYKYFKSFCLSCKSRNTNVLWALSKQ